MTLEAQTKAVATYNAAADFYDDPANAFWNRFGQRTVERLSLARDARVLDVCCGSGASAIPAAEQIGPRGSVLGIDLAGQLLALARAKAESRGLAHAEFRSGDLLDLRLPEASFDAVVCVFGIFFVDDAAGATRSLVRLVRPGGLIAITTWGPRFGEPVNSIFWDAVQRVRPDLIRPFRPWDRICEPDALRALFDGSGVASLEVDAEAATHPIRSPDDWWSMVRGSGYRGTIEELGAEDQARVRTECAAFIRETNVRCVETNVVYAIATRAS